MPGDGLDAIPQDVGVVNAQGGDGGEDGLADDVGVVVGAADAHLHDGHVHALVVEDVVGEDGEELEVGRLLLGRGVIGGADAVVDGPEVGGELLLGDGHAVDADPFGDGDQVGGGVEAGLVAGPTEDGLGEGACGAFAFCAGHVDHLRRDKEI